mmetsp:Transcript_12452/g.16961  ORF Transcript_12452/g.16961 Transcript_12452/m.16961 type:complete len:104 (-) Transcript_12452:578-889(-)
MDAPLVMVENPRSVQPGKSRGYPPKCTPPLPTGPPTAPSETLPPTKATEKDSTHPSLRLLETDPKHRYNFQATRKAPKLRRVMHPTVQQLSTQWSMIGELRNQ